MLNQATLEKMQEMRMHALAEAFEQQFASSQYAELSFEERVGLLIDTEWTSREQRKLTRRLKAARLRYQASLEDVDFKTPRGLDRQVVLSLGTCRWIQDHQNLILTGPTGTGKSFLACAFSWPAPSQNAPADQASPPTMCAPPGCSMTWLSPVATVPMAACWSSWPRSTCWPSTTG
jgi:hypothetical protein